MKAPSSPSLEQFGYRQELKRSLSLFDLVGYGLVGTNILAAFTSFGIVFNASRGMVPLVYVVVVIAMTFTCLSYMMMSRAFPVAGSVYSYAGRGIGESAGFIAGWAMLLDYALLAPLVYVAGAVAFQAVFPDVPRTLWIVLMIGFNTAISLLGIETTARMNRLFVFLMFATLGLFVILAGIALANGVEGAELSAAPFFKPSEVSPSLIFGALAVAISTFLGFDAISTLAEEARGGPSMIGRAMLLTLLLVGALFVFESYLASLFVLNRSSFTPGQETDGAIYMIAALIGGAMFRLYMASTKVLIGLGVALAWQTATARLVFGMARDGKLPRFFAHVHAGRKVPDRAILLVAVVNLIVGVFLANQLELLFSMIAFGAMTGLLLLHASVVVHFVWRQKSRQWGRHLVVPIIGFAIIAYVLLSMGALAKVAGLAWLSIGLVVLIAFKLNGRRVTLPA